MSRNLTRVNTSQRRQEEVHEREEATEEIENEITLLTKYQQETRNRLKTLKASKSDIRKRKSSSKAESNSSGRVRTATISSKKKENVTKAAKICFKKCTLFPFQVFFFAITMTTSSAEIKSRQFEAAGHTHIAQDLVMDSGDSGEVFETVFQPEVDCQWENGGHGLPSGVYFLNVLSTVTVVTIIST